MKIYNLTPSNKRYDAVCNIITQMYQNIQVTNIEYIENENLTIKNKDLKIINAFFEITSNDNIYNIISEGFKEENKVNSICGIGIPLTKNLNLETIKLFGKYLYCKVGVDGYDYNIYGEKYNTYVDNKEDPTIFIAKDVKNVCPIYIISYKVL